MRNEFYFPHEKLDCYRLSRDVARWIRQVQFPRGDSDLYNQAMRSSSSVAMNIAEGTGRNGKSRRYHYDVASGSAAETAAALDIVDIEGAAEQINQLQRVYAMLRRMR